MKKLISILLAAAMVVSLSASTLAVDKADAETANAPEFILGHIIDNNKGLSPLDAIEILKYLAGMPSLLTPGLHSDETYERALQASLITVKSQIAGEPAVQDAIEILKELAGMHSGLSFMSN